MLQKLLWCALATALVVGTAQTLLQQFQAIPIVLAAEQFEEQRTVGSGAQTAKADHHHDDHSHSSSTGAEQRTLWTWVANFFHAFGVALLFFSVLMLWFSQKDSQPRVTKAVALLAGAGFISLHLWPSLGLPAEIPGMNAAALGDRQTWWILAAVCAGMGCAIVAFRSERWRWPLGAAVMAIPFIVGAPHLTGDAFTGYTADAMTQLRQLSNEFIWASRWLAVSFWILTALVGGILFKRQLLPMMMSPRKTSLGNLVGSPASES